MCVYFCVVVCVDDNNNGKEVEKKKEGRNTIFNTHTRERIKKTKKNKTKKRTPDRPTVRFFFSLSSFGEKIK